MLNEDIRQARVAAGLSQAELARRAGITRKQLRFAEEGGNITVDTLRKIAAMLPNLKRMSLGEAELTTASPDLEEARRAALDLFDVAKRLMAALGAAPPSERLPDRKPPELGPVGAVRHNSMEDHERRAQEIQRERERRAGRGKQRDDS